MSRRRQSQCASVERPPSIAPRGGVLRGRPAVILRASRRKKPVPPFAGGCTGRCRWSASELVEDAHVVIQARLNRGDRTAEGRDGLVLRLVEVVAFETDAEALEPARLELVARLRRYPPLRLD